MTHVKPNRMSITQFSNFQFTFWNLVDSPIADSKYVWSKILIFQFRLRTVTYCNSLKSFTLTETHWSIQLEFLSKNSYTSSKFHLNRNRCRVFDSNDLVWSKCITRNSFYFSYFLSSAALLSPRFKQSYLVAPILSL